MHTVKIVAPDPEYRERYAASLVNEHATSELPNADVDGNAHEGCTEGREDAEDNTEEVLDEDGDTDEDDTNKKWNGKTTKLLIVNRLKLDEKFRNPKAKKATYWKMILKDFHLLKYANFTIADLYSKWKNILVTYNRNIDKLNKTGESAITWQYFPIIHEVFGKKRNVIPPESSLGSSMKPTSSRSETGMSPSKHSTCKRIAAVSTDNCTSESVPLKKSQASKKIKLDVATSVGEAIKEQRSEALAFKENVWKERKDLEKEKIKAIRELAAAIGSLKEK